MDLLDKFIDERRMRPFVWYTNDCASFAADWVLAKTGRDPMGDLRGGRESLLATLRELHRAGGFKAIADARLGPARHGLLAQRGDIVLIRSGRRVGRASGYSFGVCTGSHIAAPGASHMHMLAVTASEAAWSV